MFPRGNHSSGGIVNSFLSILLAARFAVAGLPKKDADPQDLDIAGFESIMLEIEGQAKYLLHPVRFVRVVRRSGRAGQYRNFTELADLAEKFGCKISFVNSDLVLVWDIHELNPPT